MLAAEKIDCTNLGALQQQRQRQKRRQQQSSKQRQQQSRGMQTEERLYKWFVQKRGFREAYSDLHVIHHEVAEAHVPPESSLHLHREVPFLLQEQLQVARRWNKRGFQKRTKR